jgi:hypothetical protein
MSLKTIGIALIILGIVMIAYTGFNYITTKNVVDLGSIQVTHDENHFVHWSPYVGAVLLVGGILLTVNGKTIRS